MKLLGTPVKLSKSFIFLYLYLVVVIAWSNHNILFGFSFPTILFSIVFLHELGHFFVARLFTIYPKEIAIDAMGGHVEFEDSFEDDYPFIKFLVVFGGLFVNIIILLIFGIDISLDSIDTINLIKLLNIALLIYNILPILPLDGGKLFQYTFEMFGKSIDKSRHITNIISIFTSVIVMILSVHYKFWIVLFFTALLLFTNIRNVYQYRKKLKVNN